MMKNEQRLLHPFYLLISFLQLLKGFIPLFLLVVVRVKDWSKVSWYWYAGATVLMLCFLVLFVLQWRRHTYTLMENRLLIRKGMFIRDEKTIYYSRIHSVNIEQPIIHRVLGIAQVKIETPGGGNKSDGVLEALSMKEAERIRDQLLRFSNEARQQEEGVTELASNKDVAEDRELTSKLQSPIAVSEGGNSVENSKSLWQTKGAAAHTVFKLSAAQLVQAALTSLNFGLALAFLAGLYSIGNEVLPHILPEHFWENVVKGADVKVSSLALTIVIMVLIAIVVAWLLSILLYVLKYSGFMITRQGEQLSVSYGLLERKAYLFDPNKVQAVFVEEGLLRQAIGYAQVKLQLVTAGGQMQLVLHPFIKKASIQHLLDQVLPLFKLDGEAVYHPSPPKALLYYMRVPLLLTLVPIIVGIWFGEELGLLALILLPIVAFWRYRSWKNAGLLLEPKQLTLRSGGISRKTAIFRRRNIVIMRLHGSRRQRQRGLRTVAVQVLGMSAAQRLSYMSERDILPVWKWFERSHAQK